MFIAGQATRIRLADLRTPPMRAFQMSWIAFHLCFFGWFGLAPLMGVIREDLALTRVQIGNTIIASVAITILARLVIGPLCDRFGPRRTYTGLLILGGLPVALVGLADSYEGFLLARLAIGAIGASFVITQYHTSVMFAPNVVGTANATTAGWGNLGGGTTQIVMPLMFAGLVSAGLSESAGWRVAMVVPGLLLMLTGIAYYRLTRDAPEGDFRDLRARGVLPAPGTARTTAAALLGTARDLRVWALFVVYAACFGIELTINNIAALYFHDRFGLGLATAGIVAGLFGLMNLFARTLGGVGSDLAARAGGLRGRVRFLFLVLAAEGLALAVFSRMEVLAAAIAALVAFSICVQMAEGATFGVVPFVNRRALGAVAGIVGAGGNAGAVAAGYLFRSEAIAWEDALLVLGLAVLVASLCALAVRFPAADEARERRALHAACSARVGGEAMHPAAEVA